MALYENCDGASFFLFKKTIRSMAFIGIRLIISQAYKMHRRKKSGRSMKIYRMQWYSSILGGCSSDARSFLKTKPSIKLRFQAAALRVLFVYGHQKRSTHPSIPCPLWKAPFSHNSSFIGTCGNQCPWPSHGSIDGTGQGRTCGSDQPCACRRG